MATIFGSRPSKDLPEPIPPDVKRLQDESRQGNAAVVEDLLAKGVDVDHADNAGMTALHYASHRGHADVVALLLDAKANPEAKNRQAMIPMHHASAGGHKLVVQSFVDPGLVDIEAEDSHGMNMMHHAAYNNAFDVVMFGFERSVSIDSTDKNDWTPLMFAAQQGHLNMCGLLLDLGADIECTTTHGKTAVDIAATFSNLDCRMILQKALDEEEQQQELMAPKMMDPRSPYSPTNRQDAGRRGTAIAFERQRLDEHGQGVSVHDAYNVGELLGRGKFGSSTYLATHKVTGLSRVMKTLPLRAARGDTFVQQINVLKAADHPNIVRLFGSYEEAQSYHVITEYCSGGSLLDKAGSFDEGKSAKYFKQMLRAAVYLHSHDIVHRGLHLDNFLFQNSQPDAPLKLVDFGSAAKSDDQQRSGGDVYYLAPEVFHRAADAMSDMWALGVCLYVMIGGDFPFKGQTKADAVTLIKRCDLSFEGRAWDGVSREGRDVVRALLTLRPADRATADEALYMKWFTTVTRRTLASVSDLAALNQNLSSFSARNKLEKAVAAIAVRSADSQKLQHLSQIFSALDTDQDGVLSLQEVEHGLSQAGVNLDPGMEKQLGSLVNQYNEVTYSAFMSAMMDSACLTEDNVLLEAFHIFDRKADRVLDHEELAHVMGPQDADAALQQYGKNGRMTFEQFKKLITSLATKN